MKIKTNPDAEELEGLERNVGEHQGWVHGDRDHLHRESPDMDGHHQPVAAVYEDPMYCNLL